MIVEQSLSAHVIVHKDAIVFCNSAFELLSGYSRQELYSMETAIIPMLFSRGSKELFDQLARLCLDGGQIAYHPEMCMVRKNGVYGWIEMAISPIEFKGRNAVHFSCIDRSERKRRKEASLDITQAYCSLLANLKYCAIILDSKGIVSFCNEHMLEYTGWQRDDIIGLNWFDRCVPDRGLQKRYGDALEQGIVPPDDEYEIMTKNGERRTLVLSGTLLHDAIGRVSGMLCVGEDMTERRRIEIALRENQEKFVRMIENTNDGISLADEEGNVIAWNRGLESISGLKREEVLGKLHWDAVYSVTCGEQRSHETYERIKLFHEDLLTTGVLKSPATMVHRLQRPDGTRKIVQLDVFVIHTSRGHRTGVIVRDVTEQVALKEALDQSEMRCRSLVEAIPDILFVIAHDMRIVYVNSNAVRFFSMPEEEIEGKKLRGLLPPETVVSLESALARVFENGGTMIQENKMRDQWFETRLVPVVDSSGVMSAVLVISHNITRRKTAEQELCEMKDRIEAEALHMQKKQERGRRTIGVFDKARLFAITGNDSETLKKYLDITLFTGISMVDNIEKSIRENDQGKVVLLANGIRETALQLGATRVAETCAAVMIAARENRIEACHRIAPQLRRESESLFNALRAIKV